MTVVGDSVGNAVFISLDRQAQYWQPLVPSRKPSLHCSRQWRTAGLQGLSRNTPPLIAEDGWRKFWAVEKEFRYTCCYILLQNNLFLLIYSWCKDLFGFARTMYLRKHILVIPLVYISDCFSVQWVPFWGQKFGTKSRDLPHYFDMI